jgi:hypothetical protein
VLIDKPSRRDARRLFHFQGHFDARLHPVPGAEKGSHMSQDIQQQQISKKRVVYTMPGLEAVKVRRDEAYRATDAGTHTIDLYYPPDSTSETRTPAVVFVTGFSDLGAQKMIGCQQKEMGSYISWGQLVAASGLVAVTYTNTEPATDVQAVIGHVRQNAASFGVDENRVAVWACSGSVPTALSVLMQEAHDYLKCAVLCYGYTLDTNGLTGVDEAARRFGFVTPCAGKSVADLPPQVPLFIARAGLDQMPGLNKALDDFVCKALICNLPVTFVNHSTGPHAFDLFDDGETSREIIRQALAFLRFHLLA